MTLPGLVLLVILTSCDAADTKCDRCNQIGPWWPLFKPSQIIHSEFPEHAQYRSLQHRDAQYERRSQESTGQDVSSLGIDSTVKTYSDRGKHRVEWDHYGDVTRVTTAPHVKPRRGDVSISLENSGQQAPPNSLEAARPSGEDRSGREQEEATRAPEDTPHSSSKSEEENFFDNKSFFDEKFKPPKDRFPYDFSISKESLPSIENLEGSNSVELSGSRESNDIFNKRPLATSYSSMTSVFSGARAVPHQPRDLLHPNLSYNDVPTYIRGQLSIPMSRSPFSNGRNVTNQYQVHDPQDDYSGVLRINHLSHLKGKRFNPPGNFIPKDHPVYRYVKSHGGLDHHYRRQPQSRSSTLHVHPELRAKFPLKHLQPHIQVHTHESSIRHVVPTKSPFSDSFWKEPTKIESPRSPSFVSTFYFIKKKPKTVDIKKIDKRHDIVYIIKSNKRLS